jgi:hypothetical protein
LFLYLLFVLSLFSLSGLFFHVFLDLVQLDAWGNLMLGNTRRLEGPDNVVLSNLERNLSFILFKPGRFASPVAGSELSFQEGALSVMSTCGCFLLVSDGRLLG